MRFDFAARWVSERGDFTTGSIGSPTAMLVYKIMNQNIQILNKTVPIAITLHVYVLIAGDERRQSLHTNQLVSKYLYNGAKIMSELKSTIVLLYSYNFFVNKTRSQNE